jgi:hypothetical protein
MFGLVTICFGWIQHYKPSASSAKNTGESEGCELGEEGCKDDVDTFSSYVVGCIPGDFSNGD